MKTITENTCNSHTSSNTFSKLPFVVILIIAGLLNFKSVQSQTNVSVNISSQPLWGPVNYDYVEYYYLPEAEVYYYVPTSQFIYLNAGQWVYVSSLPATYHVDLYRTYKVVLNEPKPYMNHQVYVKKYAMYKTSKGKQYIIRDSHDAKYYVVKGHPGPAKVKEVKPKGENPKSAKPEGVKPHGAKPEGGKPEGGKPNNSKGKGKKN